MSREINKNLLYKQNFGNIREICNIRKMQKEITNTDFFELPIRIDIQLYNYVNNNPINFIDIDGLLLTTPTNAPSLYTGGRCAAISRIYEFCIQQMDKWQSCPGNNPYSKQCNDFMRNNQFWFWLCGLLGKF